MQANDLAKIADIIPPEAPAALASSTVIILFSSTLVLIIIGLLFYRKTLHARLLRLRRHHLQQRNTNREIAMRLRDLISIELSYKKANVDNETEQQWQAFSSQLQHACFSRTPPDDALIQALFKQSRFWLMHKQ